MYRRQSIVIGMVLMFAVGGGFGVAQEVPEPQGPPAEAGSPGTETTYLDLRRSKDRTTRQWAERYFTLTKLQDWKSAKGKTVKAKYIAHSADLASVTLAVAQGKEVTVPVAQLDKSSQSRVKQIAATQKKLDELIASGAKAEPGQAGDTPGDVPGAPMLDEGGAEPPRRQPAARRSARTSPDEPPPGRPAAADASATSGTELADDGGDDPLGFGELPPSSTPPMANAPVAGPSARLIDPTALGADDQAKAGGKDPTKWRTDYEAFRGNFRADPASGLWGGDWGTLKELKAAVDAVRKQEADQDVGTAELQERQQKFAAVGEFTWDATLTEADSSSGDWTERLNLPPLPDPLLISFSLDEENPGSWQNLKAGDRVRFSGRFVDFVDGELEVVIRFLNEAAAGGATARPRRPVGTK